MRRVQRMCIECPFRLPLSQEDKIELAKLEPEAFQCHTEAGYTSTDIQCRGHFEVRRKFNQIEDREA